MFTEMGGSISKTHSSLLLVPAFWVIYGRASGNAQEVKNTLENANVDFVEDEGD